MYNSGRERGRGGMIVLFSSFTKKHKTLFVYVFYLGMKTRS